MMQCVRAIIRNDATVGREEQAETGGGRTASDLIASKTGMVRHRGASQWFVGRTVQRNCRRTPSSPPNIKIRQQRSHTRGPSSRLGIQRATALSATPTTGTQPRTIGRGLHALLLRSFHLQTQVGLVAMEPFVAVGTSVRSLGNSTKAIKVELSLEGC